MMESLPKDKLVELLYLLMRDAAPTGEIVRVIRMIDARSSNTVVYSSKELEAYARRLVEELLS